MHLMFETSMGGPILVEILLTQQVCDVVLTAVLPLLN